MLATQPGRHADRNVGIREVHHRWRYEQDPRLRRVACIAVIQARECGTSASNCLPVCNAERGRPIISLLAESNASGNAEQIGETVNTGRLYARIKHNPNFVDGGCTHCHLSLVAKTLTLAAIVKCPPEEAPYQRSGSRDTLLK